MKKAVYLPSLALQKFVECYHIIHHSTNSNASITMIDFPRTAMDMVFCFEGNILLNLANENQLKINRASYIGNFDTPYEITFSKNFSIFHVRFKPNGIYPLTKIPLRKIINEELSLEELINDSVNELYEKLGEVEDDLLRIKILETYLLQLYSKSDINYRLDHAISIIQQQKGLVTIKELSNMLNTNYKSLERWFQSKVGFAPKKFATITRFKNIIEDLEQEDSPNWMKYVEHFNFHDQSHFIKSFEEYSGLTPENYWQLKSTV